MDFLKERDISSPLFDPYVYDIPIRQSQRLSTAYPNVRWCATKTFNFITQVSLLVEGEATMIQLKRGNDIKGYFEVN